MFNPLYPKRYQLILLSGGILEDQLKSLLKLKDSELTIIEKIFEIFSKYDNSKIIKKIISLPENYLNYVNNLPVSNFENIKKYLIDYEIVFSGERLVDTIKNVLNKLLNEDKRNINNEDDEYFLFVATDVPFISYESINDILFRLDYIDGDVFLPIVSKEVYEVKFSSKASKLRTFVKFKNDSFCAASLFVIKKNITPKFMNLLETILENRKKPLKLAEIFGYDIFIKLIFKNLTVLELEQKISDLFNIKAHAILTNYPELAFNIDKKQDLEFYYNNSLLTKI
ncbi:MAG: hypothetical protein N2485_03215 [bacterium]|nr:hypothetical protein [bacterium]